MRKKFVNQAKGNGTRADWHVYILECADGTLYTGSTNDLARRVREHNESALGAKYTKARRPVALRYESAHESRGAALKEEARIKALSRPGKQALLSLKWSLKKKS